MVAFNHNYSFYQCLRALFTCSNIRKQPHHDFSVVQALCVLLKLHSDSEVDLVVSEGAQGLCFKLVSVLDDHFCLMQVGSYLSGGKVNVCKHEHTRTNRI